MEDEKIIRLFFERSEQAITELSKKYGDLCTRIAENILHNGQDAEECVNDTWLGVWNSVPPLAPNSLAAYVTRIVRNKALKRYHANTAVKRNSHYDLSLSEIEECFSTAENPEEETTSREIGRQIDIFLSGLDRNSRVLFIRRYWFGDSLEELGRLFDTEPHTVSVRLARIRKKMKKELKKKGVFL